MSDRVTHVGGCHCGDVRFEVVAPRDITAVRCNCSICRMSGFEHLFVAKENFRLLTEWDALSLYRFNTGVARHYFCKRCGVKSFYVPRSHPDGYSIHVQCLRPDTLGSVQYESFDGADWEGHIGSLRARKSD